MPRVVVRKGYRCQPGKRREVLTALQRIDEAAAAAGYPRGRYLFVETRAPGEPDLEVEFTFESYAEMEQLERRMREHVARVLRDGGSTGQEHLLEPSATRHLLLLDEPQARQGGAAATPAGTARPAPPRPASAPRPAAAAQPPRPAAGASPTAPVDEPPPWQDVPDEDFEGLDEADLPEPDVPPPPALPQGMSSADFQRAQLDRARAALSSAERSVQLPPRAGDAAPSRDRRPGPGSRKEPASDE